MMKVEEEELIPEEIADGLTQMLERVFAGKWYVAIWIIAVAEVLELVL